MSDEYATTSQENSVDEVIATIAHDLRGPLTTLSISSDILLADLSSSTLHRQDILRTAETIRRTTLWMHGLVDNLLMREAISSKTLVIVSRQTSVTSVWESVRPTVEPILTKKAQRLCVHDRSGEALVLADPVAISRVMANLVLNAHQYSPEDTVIHVVHYVSCGSVVTAVYDRGRGVAGKPASKLFQPHFRAPEARRISIGNGLGLAIAKALVDKHGGSIGFANRPGGGARFWFSLPQVTAAVDTRERQRS